MNKFSARERNCEAGFMSAGPYWHAYTSGKETPILFTDDGDMKLAMNMIAQGAARYPVVTVIAFELMNNHFHFILSANDIDIMQFWRFLRGRMQRAFPLVKDLQLKLKPIDALKPLRNSIVYTNRNGYVANPGYTPFSYPWGTGHCYFMNPQRGQAFRDITVRRRREIFRTRDPGIPEDWEFADGYIIPSAFCAIEFGMSLFRDAHHYFAMVSRNVEAYSGIAVDIDDGEFLTDTELFGQLSRILRERYKRTSLRDLTNAQKHDFARCLHYDFCSSNGQIRRVLGLTQYEVDSLFPLSAKK
jgi:hypothetical protein